MGCKSEATDTRWGSLGVIAMQNIVLLYQNFSTKKVWVGLTCMEAARLEPESHVTVTCTVTVQSTNMTCCAHLE